MTIAAILTCHNRSQKTLACLHSLFVIEPDISVYLTDDGCTDGTAENVRDEFPQVHIIQGDGQLYWNRGMHRAWSEAQKQDYDYYLWLNDDVELYEGFLGRMMACAQNGQAVVSGLVEEKGTGEIIYGGYDRQKKQIGRSSEPQSIYWMNGNVVLISRQVVNAIGLLDPYYIHDLGDVDYGLRVQAKGFAVLTTPDAVAAGYRNDVCRIRRSGVSFRERFRILNTPLGSPLRQNFYFRRRYYGLMHAIAYCGYIITLNILPDGVVDKNK